MDVMTPEQRSRCMANIRGTNTRPELQLRRTLWKAGYRYALHARLPGRPDLLFVSAKVAVFVDGCFWHQCPKHNTRPKTNARFWKRRLEGNVQRDERVNLELKQLGHKVLRFWEHEVENNPLRVLRRIQKVLEKRPSFPFSVRPRTL
jgi:DNA mismatch endonuclease, patch repair protein